MGDIVIIGMVVAVAVGAHVWLFRWVKFKIDEGVIFKCIDESPEAGALGSEDISVNTNMRSKRVVAVCRKSKRIHKGAHAADTWCINAAHGD